MEPKPIALIQPLSLSLGLTTVRCFGPSFPALAPYLARVLAWKEEAPPSRSPIRDTGHPLHHRRYHRPLLLHRPPHHTSDHLLLPVFLSHIPLDCIHHSIHGCDYKNEFSAYLPLPLRPRRRPSMRLGQARPDLQSTRRPSASHPDGYADNSVNGKSNAQVPISIMQGHARTPSYGAAGFAAARSPPKAKSRSIIPILVDTILTTTPGTSHVPCKFYPMGQCQAGAACQFSHDLDPTTQNAPCKYFSRVSSPAADLSSPY